MYQAKEVLKAKVIEDLKNPMNAPSLNPKSFKEICNSVNPNVTVVYSAKAGLGKSHWIRKQASRHNRELIEIPLYG